MAMSTSSNASLVLSANSVERAFCPAQHGELWKPNVVADADPDAPYVCKQKRWKETLRLRRTAYKKPRARQTRKLEFGKGNICVDFVAVGRQKRLALSLPIS